MEILFETDRLLVREIQDEDEAGMFMMESDPEVHRYIGRKPVSTPLQSRAIIRYVQEQYLEFGIGRWAVLEKESREFMGWTGFKFMTETINGHINFHDFGYRFMRKYWGKGYATESGLAALNFGLTQLKLADVYAMTHKENEASGRVLEKLGFKFMEVFQYDGKPTPWREPQEDTKWFAYDINNVPKNY